jgi:hypothetical protein
VFPATAATLVTRPALLAWRRTHQDFRRSAQGTVGTLRASWKALSTGLSGMASAGGVVIRGGGGQLDGPDVEHLVELGPGPGCVEAGRGALAGFGPGALEQSQKRTVALDLKPIHGDEAERCRVDAIA